MTLQEVVDSGIDWEEFCDQKGFSVWAVNEGGGDVQVTFTLKEARELGLLRTPTTRD